MKLIKPLFFLLFLFVFRAVSVYSQSHDAVITEMFIDLLRYSDYQSHQGYKVAPKWQTESFEQGEAVKIINKKPAFGWIWTSSQIGATQVAYQLLVSDDLEKLKLDQGIIWDSEKVTSQQSQAIPYKGKDLLRQKLYYWKVKVWSQTGLVESRIAAFYTGSLRDDYFTAQYPLQKTDQAPVAIKKIKEDIHFIDFGKAAFGQLRITISSKKADTVRVRLGEKIDDQGRIDRKPGGTIRYQEHTIPLTPGLHSYYIRFEKDKRNTGPAAILMPQYIGEVLPFRYVEVIGYPHSMDVIDITRSMVHYPFDDEASYFTSSDTILNQIWDLSKYSIKATSFAGIYVDGDRERIPYEADALINQLSHYGVDLEYSMARRSHEYLMRKATWPTEWIMQSVMMAWYDYLYTGDLRSIAHYYEDLKAKSLTALQQENNLISTKVGKQTQEFLQSIHLHNDHLRDIVDWPQKGILGLGKNEEGETDGFVFTDYNAVVNAYYYHALTLMEKIARELGKSADANYYELTAKKVYQAYQKNFFDSKRNIYVDGIGTDHAALHTNMFALAFNLVPQKHVSSVVDFIKSRGMACSVYGSQFLMDALYDYDQEDYALQLLTSTDERSWYNMIRVGSTISLEAWDNKYKPNQDWNHAWGAAPANIIPRKLMGIEPLTPAWETFRVKPQLSTLEQASIKVPTMKGFVYLDYAKQAHADHYTLTVPTNTEALVSLAVDNKNYAVLINGQKTKVKPKNSRVDLPALAAGVYHIELKNE